MRWWRWNFTYVVSQAAPYQKRALRPILVVLHPLYWSLTFDWRDIVACHHQCLFALTFLPAGKGRNLRLTTHFYFMVDLCNVNTRWTWWMHSNITALMLVCPQRHLGYMEKLRSCVLKEAHIISGLVRITVYALECGNYSLQSRGTLTVAFQGIKVTVFKPF
jgi:hypothetical protein